MKSKLFKNLSIFFKIKCLRKLFVASLISQIGDRMFLAALPLYVLIKQQDVVNFSKIIFFETIPYVFLTAIIAQIVDKHNKKYLIVASDFISMILIALLLLKNSPLLYYIVSFMASCCTIVSNSCKNTLYFNLISPDNYPVISSLESTIKNIIKISITPITAFLLFYLDPRLFFILNMISFAVSGTVILAINDPMLGKASYIKSSFFEEINNIANLIKDPILRIFIIYSAIGGMVIGLIHYFVPIYLVKEAKVSLINYPILGSFETIGSLFIGSLIITYSKRLNFKTLIFVCMFLMGLLFTFLGFTTIMLIIFLIFFLAGIFINGLDVATTSIFHSRIPNEYRTRASAIFSVIGSLSASIPGIFLFMEKYVSSGLLIILGGFTFIILSAFVFISFHYFDTEYQFNLITKREPT